MYTAIKTFSNGLREEKEFDNYDDMCDWFALTPEAGMQAYLQNDTNDSVNQIELQTDVAARL